MPPGPMLGPFLYEVPVERGVESGPGDQSDGCCRRRCVLCHTIHYRIAAL